MIAVVLAVALVAPITGGGTASTDDAVVALAFGDVLVCSGTVIAPHAVLTAAHCVSGSQLPDLVEGAAVVGGLHHPAVAAFVAPGFDAATLDHDVAVVIVDAPFAVTPLALATAGTVTIGSTIRVVGYGFTMAGDTTPAVRRTGVSQVDAIDALRIASHGAPAQTCEGDSGGPALVGDVVVGVASSGDVACTQVARHARTDADAAFVAGVVAETAAGSALAGARCWYATNCAQGAACLPARDEPRWSFCAPACDPGACANELVCVEGSCVYPIPSPGAQDAPCTSASDCAGALCLAPAANAPTVCTTRCFADLPGFACPMDTTCVSATDGGDACFAAAPEGGSGCHVGRDGGGWLALVLALAVSHRGRVRRPT